MRSAYRKKLSITAEYILNERVEALLSDFDPQNQPAFSSQFKDRIAAIRNRGKRHVIKHVAVVFLAILLSGFLFLSVNTEARAAFTGWVRSFYQEYLRHMFVGNAPSNENTRNINHLKWLPDGYELLSELDNGIACISFYANTKDGAVLKYQCIYAGGYAEQFTATAETDVEEIQLNHCTATILIHDDPAEANVIFWSDESGRLYSISGLVDRTTLIEIAKSQKK